MIEKNSKLKENINCDVSDEIIDFSLKNHMSEVFSDFVENSMKTTCKRAARSLFMLIVGVFSGIGICALGLIAFIKLFGIKNTWIHSTVKSCVSKLVNDEHMRIGSTELAFSNGAFNIILKDVKIKNLKVPQLNIIPSFFKTIFSRKLQVQAIEFCNSDIELAVSNKTGNFFIKNYFDNKADKLKYLPVARLNKNLSVAEINYRLKNSNITLRKGYDAFRLNGVSGEFDGRTFKIMNAAFAANTGNNMINFKIDSIRNTPLITASFKNVRSNELIRALNEKKIEILSPLTKFVSLCNDSEVSGEVSFLLNDDNTLKSGRFNLKAKNGILASKVGSSSFGNSVKHIELAEGLGTFNNEMVYLDSLSVKFNKSHVKLTGVVLKNNNIHRMDGTLELTNVSKADLSMLPASISNACFALFKNNLSNFTLPSLKMDIRTVDKNASVPDYLISHGKFEMKDGTLPLANKIMSDVYASGEIVNDTVKLTLHSANLDNMKINSGYINIKDFGDNWNGTINTVLTAENFIKQLNIFKKCSIPFDKFLLNDKVNCSLSIVSDAKEKKRGFKIISGEGVIISGAHQINVKWDKNNAYVSGIAETKANRSVDINIGMDLKNNTGEKNLIIDSDNDVVASINETIAATLNGKYKITLSEKWNGARGTYAIRADLNGALLTLPVFGNVKTKSQPGTISAIGEIDGASLKFDRINIDTNDKHIQGKMVINRETNEILSCDFADKSARDSNYILSIKSTDNNSMKMNVIGSYLDISNIWKIISNVKKSFVISMRIDQAKISDTQCVRHLKGRVNIKNGHIVDGAACCNLLDGSSIVLDSSLVDKNSSVVNLNVANAGQFFKDLNITESVIGGKLKMSIASDLNGNNDIRAINCELSDILVKNNETLAKITSLSTPNNIDLKNFSLGFNGVVCSLTMKNNDVVITDGKAIGPMLCLSFSGTYNKSDDDLKLSGIAVPVNGYTAMGGQVTYSPYSLFGSIFENRGTDVSVNPMVMTDHNILRGLFGMKMSIDQAGAQNTLFPQPTMDSSFPVITTGRTSMPEIKPISSTTNTNTTPIVEKEERYIKQPVDLDKVKKSTTSPRKTSKKVTKDKELGITITRGA